MLVRSRLIRERKLMRDTQQPTGTHVSTTALTSDGFWDGFPTDRGL